MTANKKHKILTYFIAAVWFVNGMFCKVLNLVPRHEQIVSRILGNEHSRLLTVLIGCSEVCMAIWVVTRFQSRFNAIIQILVIAVMNIMEFFLVPDLLLWNRLNIVYASMFIAFIYYNEFVLNKKLNVSS